MAAHTLKQKISCFQTIISDTNRSANNLTNRGTEEGKSSPVFTCGNKQVIHRQQTAEDYSTATFAEKSDWLLLLRIQGPTSTAKGLFRQQQLLQLSCSRKSNSNFCTSPRFSFPLVKQTGAFPQIVHLGTAKFNTVKVEKRRKKDREPRAYLCYSTMALFQMDQNNIIQSCGGRIPKQIGKSAVNSNLPMQVSTAHR